ncbi:helix-turn-helix transcriptional regulator [Nocardia sp. NPDC057227]|uniref:helix-turn-helix transcriptional regulator n=1 Tax=Nocardia sp. NPDC057227 TaxID=3346056 RepID=UPI0036257F32
MRADRLVAVLLLMQTRGRVTAAEIAAELEISVATARRDLEALGRAGVPVYPQPGRNGGWQLVGGARTDLTGLTAGEARALFLLAGPAAGGVPEGRSALRKLVRALPKTFRGDAEAAADSVVLDPAGWGAHAAAAPPLVAAVQDAVIRRDRLRLGYLRRGEQTSRVVDPWSLVDKDGIWYLIAGTDRGRRTFRLDRVTAAEPTGETFDRPADFDPAAAWRETVGAIERRRAAEGATVLVAAHLVPVLEHQQGRHCTVIGPDGDGRVRVRITAPTPRMIAQQLAGWGTELEVVEPESVRAELARIGAELVARYRGTASSS